MISTFSPTFGPKSESIVKVKHSIFRVKSRLGKKVSEKKKGEIKTKKSTHD
jgi:hypothetical protein